MNPGSTASDQTLPEYSGGAYMLDPSRHGEDAAFKAQHFLQAFHLVYRDRAWQVRSLADVGCGSGVAVRRILQGLERGGITIGQAFGYDVYPEVEKKTDDRVRFVCGDFPSPGGVDLVTLFDVFEHVPDPVRFLGRVAAHCKYMGLHVPLENNWNCALRDKYRTRIHRPGHLIYLDAAETLTILSLAGLRVVHFHYTPGFMAPSGGQSVAAKCLRLPRRAAFALNPWLLSKTLGGCSMMVLAETPQAWRPQTQDESNDTPTSRS